jgi:hypothetical protein
VTEQKSVKFTFNSPADPDPESNFSGFLNNFVPEKIRDMIFLGVTPDKTRILLAKLSRKKRNFK